MLPAEPDQVHQERSGTCAQLLDRREPKSLRDSDHCLRRALWNDPGKDHRSGRQDWHVPGRRSSHGQ